MEALLVAQLEVDEAGCVYAQAEGGRVTLVWPKGYVTAGDADSFDVLDADGDVVARSGTELAIGGGGVDDLDPAWGEADCATDALWLVGEVANAE